VNGSLRQFFNDSEFLCMDMESHSSVDIVCKPGEPFPFADNCFDVILSTSCFEHDPLFWMTFIEMTRVVKPNGIIYINAPSSGYQHNYPGDNWRFYAHAADSLAYWSYFYYKDKDLKHIVTVQDKFIINAPPWNDSVMVFRKETNSDIKVYDVSNISKEGPLYNLILSKHKQILKR
jgi:SAM-dependent methyltransferase